MFKTFTALAVALPLSWAFATSATAEPEVVAVDAAAAKVHFGKAKEFYLAGNYKAAKTELEQAQRLDPNAKELVLNLANVCEKLAAYDEAIKWYGTYKALPSVTAEEQTRADASLRRIEGAKRAADEEAAKQRAADEARRQDELAKNKTIVVIEKPVLHSAGKIDALTISAAAVGVVGLGVGTAFGLKAMADDPGAKRDIRLTSDFNYAAYLKRFNKSQDEAKVSTVAFAIGLASSVGAVILYFARPSETPVAPKAGDVSVGLGSLSVRFQ